MTTLVLFCLYLKGFVIMDATMARPTGLRLDYGQRLYDFAFFYFLFIQQFTPDGLDGYPEFSEEESRLGFVLSGICAIRIWF